METFNSLFMVSPLLLGVLFFVAMLAGFIDSIAGGGGLLTIPALMAAGMSPANALATNKLQACGGSISATIYFIRRKVVSLSDQKLNIAMTFVGSMSGALLVQYVQADVLRQILPILVICIGLYFLLMPKRVKKTASVGCMDCHLRWWRGAASVFTMDSLARLPDRFTRWPSLRCADSTSPKPLLTPNYLTQRQTLAVCCCLFSAAK